MSNFGPQLSIMKAFRIINSIYGSKLTLAISSLSQHKTVNPTTTGSEFDNEIARCQSPTVSMRYLVECDCGNGSSSDGTVGDCYSAGAHAVSWTRICS